MALRFGKILFVLYFLDYIFSWHSTLCLLIWPMAKIVIKRLSWWIMLVWWGGTNKTCFDLKSSNNKTHSHNKPIQIGYISLLAHFTDSKTPLSAYLKSSFWACSLPRYVLPVRIHQLKGGFLPYWAMCKLKLFGAVWIGRG